MPSRLLAFLFAIALSPAPCLAQMLDVWPAEVKLTDPFSRQQVLARWDGRDVTNDAVFASSAPTVVAVQDHGYLAPLADGEATITVSHSGATGAIAVRVSGFAQPRPVDFQSEIVPLLSRHGCNAGGCHGKASGQNGFKLSLFGFDAASTTTRSPSAAAGGGSLPRLPTRACSCQSARQAFRTAAAGESSRRAKPYQIMRAWIAAGAPASAPRRAAVTKLGSQARAGRAQSRPGAAGRRVWPLQR